MKTVNLKFHNPEAFTTDDEVDCTEASVSDICRWYGSYNVGDPYTVLKDGVPLEVDLNGELV